MITCHTINWTDTDILTTNSRQHQRDALEAWHIRLQSNPVNTEIKACCHTPSTVYYHPILYACMFFSNLCVCTFLIMCTCVCFVCMHTCICMISSYLLCVPFYTTDEDCCKVIETSGNFSFK